MQQEHLSHPEQAPHKSIDEGLTERADLFYGRELADRVEDREFLTNSGICESLLTYLDLKHTRWNRTIESPLRVRLGEIEYTKRSVKRAGEVARADMKRKVRGSGWSPEERQRKFAEAQGKACNRRMSFLGEVRWYEDHQEAFEAFRAKVGAHLDFLEGHVEASPFGPADDAQSPDLPVAA